MNDMEEGDLSHNVVLNYTVSQQSYQILANLFFTFCL